MTDGRQGSVLALAVVLLMALQLLAHGTLLMARHAESAAVRSVELVRVRHAAEAEVRRRMVGGEYPAAVPAGGAVSTGEDLLAGLVVGSTVRRLSREEWLWEGRARAPEAAGGLRVARAVWLLDPVARVAALPGLVVVDSLGVVELAGGAVSGGEAPLAGDCPGWDASLDSVFPHGAPPGVARVASTHPVGGALGYLDWSELKALAPAALAGTGTPMPAADGGACLEAQPWNLGEPDDPHAPCGGHQAFRHAADGVAFVGGRGQGLVVAAGDLSLDGHRFTGLLVVRGVLTLQGGASVTGMIRAAGGVLVEAGATVQGSPCSAVEALAAARGALAVPVEVPGSGWIGPLPYPGS